MLAYHASVGDLFKALADPTRRAILDELTERNGQTLFELCVRLTSGPRGRQFHSTSTFSRTRA
jgi:DNA-binding transcriptional ArsR family regulator